MSQAVSDFSYCKLYVSSVERSAVVALLAAEIGAEVSGYSATSGTVSFDVLRNPDADNDRRDDFIFWPTIVEVTNEGGSEQEIVPRLSTLLRSAWGRGIAIVVACPFEDKLPWSGGIERVRG